MTVESITSSSNFAGVGLPSWSQVPVFKNYYRVVSSADSMRMLTRDAAEDGHGTIMDTKYRVNSDMALTPVKLGTGAYKILCGSTGLGTFPIYPRYTMLSHGILRHTYSLLPEQVDPYRPLTMRPLAVYQTASKTLSHATISDLTSIFPSINRRREFETSVPSSIRLCFFKDSIQTAHVELRVNQVYSYRWQLEEYPAFSNQYIYIMRRQKLHSGWLEPVAYVTDAKFVNPTDGSKLWSVEIDSSKVSPELALLSCFCGKTLNASGFIAASVLGKVPRLPKPLYNTAYEDDYVNLVPTRTGSDKIGSDDESEIDLDDMEYPAKFIKVFSSSALSPYSIPSEVLDFLNVQTKNWVRMFRIKYHLDQ